MATRNRKPRQLTDDDIAALPIKKARYSKVDTEQRGLHIRITPNGVKTFFWSPATQTASKCGTGSATP